MLTTLNDLMLSMMDVLLGWMLVLPKDVILLIVAVATSAILTFVRPFTANQDLLQRCKTDKEKLKELIRQAKLDRNKEALARHRATVGQIAMKTMRAEGKPLLVAIVPVAFLAVWCFGRLGFAAPMPGQPVTVQAYFPGSAIGNVAHVLPVEGLSAETGWVQRIAEDPVKGPDGKVNGRATWELSGPKRAEPYRFEVFYKGKAYTKELLVDGRLYSPVLEFYDDTVQVIELDLKPYKPLGIIPGISRLLLDPWIVGYLLITIPVVFLLRWMFSIC